MSDMVIDADAELLARLRTGDEAAFMELVDRYGPVMLRIALAHTPSRAVAEEVVQEAWLGVVTGLERFEGRSSLKTWLLRIVANRARTRGERERPQRAALLAGRPSEPAVDPDRFFNAEHPLYPGGWSARRRCRAGPRSACSPPRRWRRCARRSTSSRRASRK